MQTLLQIVWESLQLALVSHQTVEKSCQHLHNLLNRAIVCALILKKFKSVQKHMSMRRQLRQLIHDSCDSGFTGLNKAVGVLGAQLKSHSACELDTGCGTSKKFMQFVRLIAIIIRIMTNKKSHKLHRDAVCSEVQIAKV